MKFKKDYLNKSFFDEEDVVSFISFLKVDLLKFYDSDYCSLLLPSDRVIVEDCLSLAVKKKNYSHLVVVGIGGSNLGSLAIIEAIFGKYHLFERKKKVFFADTTDSDSVLSILNACKKKKFLLLFVSKSGTTTESVVNFEFFLKHIPVSERKDRVIVISDVDSKLLVYAKNKGYDFLCIPKKVGGRYSVFSAVGLFPLSFVGVDVERLLFGASDAIGTFDKKNVALQGALDLFHNYKGGRKINDLFIFSSNLESLGKWYRQLMGESLGKKDSFLKKGVRIGITPTVSLGSVDLHSVGQLYLGGPRDKFTSFLSVEKSSSVSVPLNKNGFMDDFSGFSFDEIMSAILKGTMNAYKKNDLPFNHYELKSKNEYELGFFMQTKMLEIMILAHLLKVDAFNQPSVEDYKVETRKFLKKLKQKK